MEEYDDILEKIDELYNFKTEENNKDVLKNERDIEKYKLILENNDIDQEVEESNNAEAYLYEAEEEKKKLEDEKAQIEYLLTIKAEIEENNKELEKYYQELEKVNKEIKEQLEILDNPKIKPNALKRIDAQSYYYELSQEKEEIENKIRPIEFEKKAKIATVLYGNKEAFEQIENQKNIENVEKDDKEILKDEDNKTQIEDNSNKSNKEKIEEDLDTKKSENNNEKLNFNDGLKSQELSEKYHDKLNALNMNKDAILTEMEDLKAIISGYDVDSLEGEFWEESENDEPEILDAKQKYALLIPELEQIDNEIDELDGLKNGIENIKNIEDEIIKIDEKLNEIKAEIEKQNEILSDENLSEDSSEKINAKKKIEKLLNEKSSLINDKKEKQDRIEKNANKLERLYKLDSKSKQKNNHSKNSNNFNYGYSAPASEIDNTEIDNSETQNNVENFPTISIKDTINNYNTSSNSEKSSIYLNSLFPHIIAAIKGARDFNNLTREEKNILKENIEKHSVEVNDKLKGVSKEKIADLISHVYDGNEDAIQNISKNNLIKDIYNTNKDGMITSIKDLNKMDENTIYFLQDVVKNYYDKIEKGNISPNDVFCKEFEMLIGNPTKLGIIKHYNKGIQRHFLFNIGKIKNLFSKNSVSKLNNIDKLKSDVIGGEQLKVNLNDVNKCNNDRLNLKDAVIENPPSITRDAKEVKEIQKQEVR